MSNPDIIVSFLIGCASSAVVGYLLPFFKNKVYSFLNFIYFKFSPHAIDLSGEWQADFEEREKGGNILTSSETLQFKQKGAYVEGEGIIGGKYPRQFKYSGQIIHDVLKGSYQRLKEKRGSIVGTGLFELKISPDRKTMVGKCIWLDRDTWQIEGSDYKWSKKQ